MSSEYSQEKQTQFDQRGSFSPDYPCGERFREATLSGLRLDEKGILRIFEWYKKGKDFLVYIGNKGCGKTWFCQAIFSFMKTSHPSLSRRYWNERDLFDRIRSDAATYYSRQAVQSLVDDHFLILDDVGSNYMMKGNEETFFDIIDKRYSSRLPTIITTNLDEEAFNLAYGERTTSRVFSDENEIIIVKGHDFRRRKE